MDATIDNATRKTIAGAAQCLSGAESDYDGLMALIGDARVVLLGESTHGSHEFYAERARITQRLVREKGFRAVALEADWPDAWRVNRYVRADCGDSSDAGTGGSDTGAADALGGFVRFPGWMWRNTDVLQFVDWLRGYNEALAPRERVGVYGLDLYSLFTSIDEVLRYLERVDPAAARDARARYACFGHYGEDSQAYGFAASAGMSESCRNGALAQVQQLQQRAAHYMGQDGPCAEDALFHAQQNARLVVNAEEYYRTMFGGRVSSWNLRDRHMADTLDALIGHLHDGAANPAKIVVWAHNSHIGDARATESRRRGEWNIGQLARERHGDAARLIGFSTYDGTVIAASRWDGPAEHKRVLPALPGSYEELLHQVLPSHFMLPLTADSQVANALRERRLERAIGVLYLPTTERQSHYFHASLPAQFDAIIHIDRTTAVVPLETIGQTGKEVPETYPAGL